MRPQTMIQVWTSNYPAVICGPAVPTSGPDCYAHVNSSPLLVRGCVTNRQNVCQNSNAHEKYACSEASVAATQHTGRVHVQRSQLLIGTIWKITLTFTWAICILLHNALKDCHPNWSLGIPWYHYWYVGIATAYINSRLWRQRDRRLSTGGVGTPPDEIEFGRLSELERSNYSGSNGVRTCLDDIKNSQRY